MGTQKANNAPVKEQDVPRTEHKPLSTAHPQAGENLRKCGNTPLPRPVRIQIIVGRRASPGEDHLGHLPIRGPLRYKGVQRGAKPYQIGRFWRFRNGSHVCLGMRPRGHFGSLRGHFGSLRGRLGPTGVVCGGGGLRPRASGPGWPAGLRPDRPGPASGR